MSDCCSPAQVDEYTAALLDHRERLVTWSDVAWKACGPL